MVLIPFASFLAGAILSLVMPAGLLVVVVIWYHLEQRRVPRTERTPRGSTPARPPAGNPAQPGPPASTG
jgi:hypothetical protein